MVQYGLVIFILGAAGFVLWNARSNPDTDWENIAYGLFGLLGLILPGLFKTDDKEDDGYG